MGQRFQLTAPRAKKALPWGGKLGEILFDGSAKVLVHLLAIPVRPPKPLSVSRPVPSIPAQPQDDHRVAQVAVDDAPQEIGVESRVKRKADGEVLAGSPRNRKLARTEDSKTGRSVTIFDLPAEVHHLIFDSCDFIEDIICLGLTTRYFWAFAREYLHDYYTPFLGRWAGENIVCVGDYVERGDFPPGLFSVEEANDLRQKTFEEPFDEDDDDDDDDYDLPPVFHPKEPFTLYHFTSPTISDMEKRLNLWSMSSDIHLLCRERSIYDDAAFRLTSSEMLITESTYFPRDQPWILRNLTTKEYVRSEAIALRPEYIRGPDIDVLGFGEVVLSRICWSTSDSVSMADTSNISRGVWAGHRFDITTVARHRDETKEADWRDVSQEVASEIAGIWESNYGPDWRETICK
ncbi:hypothetical protein HDV64DRAFT_258513 [Trichoderma sp. TUCIM 5745]